MKKCTECKGTMTDLKAETPEGIEYVYYKCTRCGDEIVNMQQLHTVADKYRKIREYFATISKWGLSLGLRLPKELTERYHFKSKTKVKIIPEKEGIKIIPT